MSYCSPLRIGDGVDKYLPQCSNNNFDLGFSSHIRGVNTCNPLTKSHVFPGTQQLGNETGANGPLFIFNDGIGPLVELKRRYDGKGEYRVYERKPRKNYHLYDAYEHPNY